MIKLKEASNIEAALLKDQPDDPLGTRTVLEDAYRFSCMLHGAPATAGPAADAFYRSFIPRAELGSTLYPRQVELAKRCRRSERGEVGRVGATIFPGLVKVSRNLNLPGPGVASGDTANTVVRRAQVICDSNVHCRPRVILGPACHQRQQ
ncbi:hypothetical protein V8E52_004059 [Russula decolorans]|jgi:hypothetical protein